MASTSPLSMDIDSDSCFTSSPSSSTALSSTDDPLADLTAQFRSLTTIAESQLQTLPLPTQRAISAETATLFRDYARHGSHLRLSRKLESFLNPRTSYTTTDADPGEADSTNNVRSTNALDYTPISPVLSDPGSPRITHSHDPESNQLVTSLPFYAVDTNLVVPLGTSLPSPFLDSLNAIYAIYNQLGNALLRHHTSKYGPEPLFRVGIRERLTTEVEDLLTTASNHDLGLTPETRSLLRRAFEEWPKLNEMEMALLGQVARVGADSVRLFFEDMREKRKGYFAMRVYIAAREIEREKEWKEAEAGRDMSATDSQTGQDSEGSDVHMESDEGAQLGDWDGQKVVEELLGLRDPVDEGVL